jgi:hypothetical protein
MLYMPRYAAALRCIGQALQSRNIEVFELKTHSDEFRLQGGDSNPPYTALVELRFSIEDIKMIDHAGRARRGQSKPEIRFESLPEILRVVGEYIDNKRAYLRRVDNSRSLSFDDPIVEIEYETRVEEVRLENLTMSFLRESAVRIYQERTQPSDLVSSLSRQHYL